MNNTPWLKLVAIFGVSFLVVFSILAIYRDSKPVLSPVVEMPIQDDLVAPPPSLELGCGPKAMTVEVPKAHDTVSLPFTVKAIVNNAAHPECRWTVFEAQAASMKLVDLAGQTVATGILTTSDEWMTDQPLRFSGTIASPTPVNGPMTLVITEENPRGELPSQEILIPLTIEAK